MNSGVYHKLWNPVVMRVFQSFVDDGAEYLFAITGDIDNLGLYVAANGRARAENFVDLVNQLIRNELRRWAREKFPDIFDIAVVLSGEEILCVGTAKRQDLIDDLFAGMDSQMNALIANNGYIDPEGTTISFGCMLVTDERLLRDVRDLMKSSNAMDQDVVFGKYLAVMEKLRHELGRQLDVRKFSRFNKTPPSSDQAAILRNFVYSRLAMYKHRTQQEVKRVMRMIHRIERDQDVESLASRSGVGGSALPGITKLQELADEALNG